MTPDEEAAALWGSATNIAYTDKERLRFALLALVFFGEEYERLREPHCDFDCDTCHAYDDEEDE